MKLKSTLFTILLSGLLLVPTFASAESNTINYTIKSGDTLWGISQKYGITLDYLRKANNQYSDMIYVGESLKIPNPTSQYEKDLLAKIVHAEAKGESYAGKVAVATVILNRVDHKDFPNTIKGVIYEPGAFTPVKNGAINNTPTKEDYRAVNEALSFRGQGNGSLFFYNPEKSKDSWIRTREVTITIGNHVFAK